MEKHSKHVRTHARLLPNSPTFRLRSYNCSQNRYLLPDSRSPREAEIWDPLAVYVHIERAHLVDLSFQDIAILMKNGEKTPKNGVFIVSYTGKFGLSAGLEIFSIPLFFREISCKMSKVRKGPLCQYCVFSSIWLK